MTRARWAVIAVGALALALVLVYPVFTRASILGTELEVDCGTPVAAMQQPDKVIAQLEAEGDDVAAQDSSAAFEQQIASSCESHGRARLQLALATLLLTAIVGLVATKPPRPTPGAWWDGRRWRSPGF